MVGFVERTPSRLPARISRTGALHTASQALTRSRLQQSSWPMPVPKAGELMIRSLPETIGYELVDAVTHTHIATFPTLSQALAAAAARRVAVWKQDTDQRGRPVGDPVLLFVEPPED